MSNVQVDENILRITSMPDVVLVFSTDLLDGKEVVGIKYTVVLDSESLTSSASVFTVLSALEEIKKNTPDMKFETCVRTKEEIDEAIRLHNKDITLELSTGSIIFERGTRYSDIVTFYNSRCRRP